MLGELWGASRFNAAIWFKHQLIDACRYPVFFLYPYSLWRGHPFHFSMSHTWDPWSWNCACGSHPRRGWWFPSDFSLKAIHWNYFWRSNFNIQILSKTVNYGFLSIDLRSTYPAIIKKTLSLFSIIIFEYHHMESDSWMHVIQWLQPLFINISFYFQLRSTTYQLYQIVESQSLTVRLVTIV